MLRLRLLAFGKLRTAGVADTAAHYRKLLRPWVQLDELELRPEAVPDKSEASRERVRELEARELLERAEGTRIFLLDEGGRSMPSAGWAELAREWETTARPVTLCIGGSLGFSPALRARAEGRLALGPQTLPHELARVVLLEQLFRAWSIVRSHPYHNA
jgi:23S rRNA (pseudouridine1915-N3)-methyltransferase